MAFSLLDTKAAETQARGTDNGIVTYLNWAANSSRRLPPRDLCSDFIEKQNDLRICTYKRIIITSTFIYVPSI